MTAHCWRDRIQQMQAQDTHINQAPGGHAMVTTEYSEDRETLRGVVARYEYEIGLARAHGQDDKVDDMLDDALAAQEQLDRLDGTTIEHVTPDVPLADLHYDTMEAS